MNICECCGLYQAIVSVKEPEDGDTELMCRACLITKAREIQAAADETLAQLSELYGHPITR